MSDVKKIIMEHWYVFVLWLLATLLLASWLFPWLTHVSREEKLSVFVGSYTMDTGELRDKLENGKPESLLELDVYSAALDDGLYDAFYTTYGLSYADVMVVPRQAVEKIASSENGNLADFFAVIPQETFSDKDWSYYSVGDANYGIRIYDSEMGQSFCSLIDFTKDSKEKQDYYILFNKDSVHLGGISEGGKTDCAVKIAELLMKL